MVGVCYGEEPTEERPRCSAFDGVKVSKKN
jgi:hypothetical protein